MKFFHVYNEECFKGLEKNGLINRDTAFKVQNVFSVPPKRQFNNIARIGGELHSLIKEGKYPFYCDRIAGGITYYKYAYDPALIREYESLLGDWFLGFQLHESASNRRQGDWPFLIKKTGSKGPYDVALLDTFKSGHAVTPDGEVLHSLGHGSIYDYAKMVFKETPEEYYEEIREMFSQRLDETLGHILPCDSYFLMTKLQDEMGMKSFMPEVGSQIQDMRIAVALARGIAKASGKTWGTYYECWHHTVFDDGKVICTMPCYNLDPINEWYLTQETHVDDFTTYGEKGGSSRLLQNRIYYHALMSGADYFSEEWGLNCSYYDMQEFTLSPYGETKKAFINDALALRGMRAKTPFAIVLPKKYSVVEIYDPFHPKKIDVTDVDNLRVEITEPFEYMNYTVGAEDEKYYKHVQGVINLVFDRDGKRHGNEGHVIKNSLFGDMFDIIYEDTAPSAMEKYDYLIDASPDGAFAKHADGKYRVLESADFEKLKEELSKLIPEVMPVTVSGLCWMVSENEDGRRFLSIFNNEGNMRTVEHGDVIDNSFDETVEVKFASSSEIKVIKEGSFASEITKVDETTYKIKVPATAFIIIEF
ncbi:MAG: hypothetical protein IKM21_05020 [Oscillospiraceae bacterium]|nr:hypothetical protein [Oscillospiraceae bacterium]